MGIRYLNKYLRNNCQEAIKCISLSELAYKKIAIDTSIYIYRYASENTLIESFYLMMGLFRKCYIIPIFIFDGKPPAEKKELLKYRREIRNQHENEYKQLEIELEKIDNEYEKRKKITEMNNLKKKITYVTKAQIQNIKDLIIAYGYSYYESNGEADSVCASLTINKTVWACMSEDMDMFVYGCPRVLRYLSLVNNNIVLYNIQDILCKLSWNQVEFRQICILAGTDYNLLEIDNQHNLYNIIKLFNNYRETSYQDSFYIWMKENNYINDYDKILKIDDMFNDIFTTPLGVQIVNGPIIKNSLRTILKNDGFIFP